MLYGRGLPRPFTEVHSLNLNRLLVATLLTYISSTCAMANELAVGSDAKVSAPQTVPLHKPAQFNWKKRDEILEMRFQSLAPSAALLKGTYEPNMDVFGPVEDGKPWWGSAGASAFGAGDRSILGPAEESRFVLNPLLLVGVNPATVGIWDPNRITEQDINNPDFPFFWLPDRLEFDAKNARATVTYKVTDFMHEINGTGKTHRPTLISNFSLVAYNARDFGYEWIHVNSQKSSNISNMHERGQPVRIRQFIHCGGTCGYPGGCNNMSPFTPEIDRLSYADLPATAVVDLWRQKPASIQQAPDFTMIIELK